MEAKIFSAATSPATTQKPTEHIGLSLTKVAQMFRVSRVTLLYYEFLGLIRRRLIGRSRVYDWEDCDRISFILKGRRLGLSLSDISPILLAGLAGKGERSRLLIERAKSQCAFLVELLQYKRLEIDTFIDELEHRVGLLSSERRSLY